MEEKIFLKLQKGLKNSSLTDESIRAIAAFKAKTIKEESEITDDFIKEGVDLCKTLDGQISFQVATIVKKQTEKPFVPPVTPPIVPAPIENPIDNVLKRVSEMEAKFQESQKQNRMLSIRNDTAKLLRAKKADKDYILENTLAKVEIADGDTAESLAEKCIPIYDNEFKKAYGEGSVPRSGTDNNQSAAETTARLKEFKEKMEKGQKK